MKKILISWVAVENDFKENGTINETGPTVSMHKMHWEYDFHLLLYTDNYYNQANLLSDYAKTEFFHKVKLQKVDVKAVHEDLQVIKSKSEQILLENSDREIDILISTGSGIMKIAWYICHTTLNLKTRIIQVLPPQISENYPLSDLVEIQTELSHTPISAVIRQNLLNKTSNDVFVTTSLKPVYDKALKIAQADNVSVLINGNTGTGKEVLANYIHNNSARKNKNFLTLNCSAFADQLLESRLFGHVKGSFTGAYADYKGIFEQADGGTVFLDEIGDISPYMQQALLRFLQFKEIQPIGGKTKKVNVRIIAATNKRITELIENNKFRNDLFFRLGLSLHIPDFKLFMIDEKKQWFNHIIKIRQVDFKRKLPLKLSNELIDFLLCYDFSGNIRELINIIDNFYVFCDEIVTAENLPSYISFIKKSDSLLLEDIEREHIKKVLIMCNNNKSDAAKILGIAINTLKSKIN